MTMRFSALLPNGEVRPFESVFVFEAYVKQWPDRYFMKLWQTPYCCLIKDRTLLY